jgi:hypothetical protein
MAAHGGRELVEGDINGDGRADFEMQVDGLGALGRGDFILQPLGCSKDFSGASASMLCDVHAPRPMRDAEKT